MSAAEFLADAHDLADQEIEVLAARAMVGVGHVDGVAAAQDGAGGGSDALLLQLHHETPVEIVEGALGVPQVGASPPAAGPTGRKRKLTTFSIAGATSSNWGFASTSPARYAAWSMFCWISRPNFSAPCSFRHIQARSDRKPTESSKVRSQSQGRSPPAMPRPPSPWAR